MARQAWSRKNEWDRDALEHIRAMLLVLAALIERAAGLPFAERLRFLAVMGCGEAEVRRLIVAQASSGGHGGWARTAATLAETTDASAYNPTMGSGDAALLAARFRTLAVAVDALLALAGAKPPRRYTSRPMGLPGHNHLTSQNTPSPALRATSPPARGRGVAASTTMFFLRTGERRSGRHWRCRSRLSLLSVGLAGGPHMSLPPPLTPPHKGEGDKQAARDQVRRCAILGQAAAERFPSPLWGGVRGGGIEKRDGEAVLPRSRVRAWRIVFPAPEGDIA